MLVVLLLIFSLIVLVNSVKNILKLINNEQLSKTDIFIHVTVSILLFAHLTSRYAIESLK